MSPRVWILSGAVAISAVSASAQSNVLSSTFAMRELAQSFYGVLNRMVKGEIPYDQAKVDSALNNLVETASKIPQAFPESIKGKSTTDSRYASSPKVWETRSDFDEYANNLTKAIADIRGKITSLDELKTAYPVINDDCNGCHKDYRVRQR